MKRIQRIRKIPVDEFTTPCPYMLEASTTVKEAVKLIKKQGIRHLPVTENQEIVGIVTERDLMVAKAFLPKHETTLLQEIMHKTPYKVSPQTPLDEVTFEMSKQKIGSAIVCYENHEYGIFTSTDALNALIEILRGLVEDEGEQ